MIGPDEMVTLSALALALIVVGAVVVGGVLGLCLAYRFLIVSFTR